MLSAADGSPIWAPATTLDILDRAAATWPQSLALACGDERLTYADYRARVRHLARRLAARGVQGERIAIVLGNSIDIALAIFAVQAAGAASATLNPDYTPAELAPMIGQLRPALTGDADRVVTLARLGAQDAAEGDLPRIDPQSIAVVQFTGGTTGAPKGAMLSHAAVATNVAQREAVLPTVPGDERIVCMMPLHHSFAAAMGLHLAAYAGGALHILPRYRPDMLLDCIECETITRLPAGPTVFNSLLGFGALSRTRVASLRSCWSGSAPLAHETLRRWEERTGVPIYEGYGQSEAGPVLTYHGPGMPLKQGSVGRPLPLTEIVIAGGGEVGEILARGPQIMRGYLDRPAESAAALAEGWLHTGDIGRIDADGYLFIEDRLKDMAIVGGFNVYPREIDEALMRCPGVTEAACIGVPDAYRGEVIWAFVVADGTDAPGIAGHLEAMLVKYKRPAQIRLVGLLPRTGVGKIDKQALKALAARERENEGVA